MLPEPHILYILASFKFKQILICLLEHYSNVVPSVQISFSYQVCFLSHKLTYKFLINEKKICKIQHISSFYSLYMLSYDSVRSDTSIDSQSCLFYNTPIWSGIMIYRNGLRTFRILAIRAQVIFVPFLSHFEMTQIFKTFQLLLSCFSPIFRSFWTSWLFCCP